MHIKITFHDYWLYVRKQKLFMLDYQSIAWLGTVDSDGGNGDTNLATCSHTAW